jgi:hypothetical protein
MKLLNFFLGVATAQLTIVSLEETSEVFDGGRKQAQTTENPYAEKGLNYNNEEPSLRIEKVIKSCNNWIEEYAANYKKKEKLQKVVEK